MSGAFSSRAASGSSKNAPRHPVVRVMETIHTVRVRSVLRAPHKHSVNRMTGTSFKASSECTSQAFLQQNPRLFSVERKYLNVLVLGGKVGSSGGGMDYGMAQNDCEHASEADATREALASG